MNIKKSFQSKISAFLVEADFDQHKLFGDVICNFPVDFTLLADFNHLP
jgi:hypothetical protein